MSPPATETGLYAWVVGMMAGYLCVAVCLNLWQHRSIHGRRELISHVFDAATFSLSMVILAGIFHPPILKLLGSTRPFLGIAGFAGVVYSVGALFPRDRP